MADLVFRNGHVFDGRTYLHGHGLAVADGRVVAVVPEADLGAYAAPGAEVVDLAGGVVQPGFQDAHVHPVQGGVERLRCDLTGLSTPGEYLAAVRAYVAAHPDRAWVLGGGWAMPAFGPIGPRAADLDAVVGDRPVFLPNRDHHGAWVSSAALRIAGIDRATPDPADGRIERDAAGAPTGTLHEGAMALVQAHVPPTSDEEHDAGLHVAQAYLHSLGVTAWQDAILGVYAGNGDPASAYLRAVHAGTLTARVRGALWWERDAGLEQVERLVERRATYTVGRLDAGSVKVMQDGVVENYTAGLSAPYRDGCGGHTHNSGLSFVDPQVLLDAVTRLDAEGFQVHVHAIGDRAVREALDAFAAARAANGRSRGRHHVAHLQVVAPADRRRFAELDVTANLQALWAVNDEAMTEMTLPFLDEELAGWQYPFGSLARAGVRLAMGSDWPVSTPDPLAALHVAVNRVDPDEPGAPFLPGEALGVEQAWAAYTSGSAHVNHLDDTGVLAPGLAADLAVLDRDPFAGDPAGIGSTRVVATYVEGAAVYRA
ncbi:amidohydrolase [Nocardioides panacis]|uniref:Amidohydrolase n=1 Tax=Nocardioides panacis TaxID=2849501 RepID=A0A975T3X4_9ACTN|nr:amidohydrolase [Nocardioides panacis]